MEIPLEKENQEKLVKFMIRIAVFSALYLVPLLAVLGCYLYENSYRAIWETTWVQEKCREYHIPCPYKVINQESGIIIQQEAVCMQLLQYKSFVFLHANISHNPEQPR